jgi:bifunctional N-acetylglucosamine-1-phosphate-uridyltransferase/glucosamine-1-phosphate-acetyltransferase GlmU-like protein
MIEGSTIGRAARIGPFARIRPGTQIGDDVHIGNFVEVKASEIQAGSKANHLSYIGDSTIGERVNVGAGTITCNYDGANKHRTVIESDVHIGSDVQLIAPVTVHRGATIARVEPKDANYARRLVQTQKERRSLSVCATPLSTRSQSWLQNTRCISHVRNSWWHFT